MALLAGAETLALAGGMTLLPTIKYRLAALVRHADVANSALVKSRIPALAALAGSIGDPAVRHRGTLGGSLANNDPAADYPAAALGLARP